VKCARAAEKAHLEDELKKKKAAQAEETAEEKKNTVGKGKLATARFSTDLTFAEQVDAVLAGAGKQKRWVFICPSFYFYPIESMATAAGFTIPRAFFRTLPCGRIHRTRIITLRFSTAIRTCYLIRVNFYQLVKAFSANRTFIL
jgi:hypothetical protein